ncbi:MAG TPA: bifunctional aspartate kinase/homoserine dehydrogenase I [Gammaproteobacteria bacterium]|nr:bifunctional aspartate kinase/homoserine dehydrogenase I [Gammaproteobacteria bacterium]
MSNSIKAVHKFGGTSLAGVAEIRRVIDIVAHLETRPVAIVVSASAGVTDSLHGLVQAAEAGGDWAGQLEALVGRCSAQAEALLAGPQLVEWLDALARERADIHDVLKATALIGRAPAEVYALVAGHGEIWSARLLAVALAGHGVDADWFDARESLTVVSSELGPTVAWEQTRRRFAAAWSTPPAVRVITGYIARDEHGGPTTLGRNGSDFSASIFAALLDAEEVVIWTDVDGVMSGDPRRIPDVSIIPELSWHEAMELAYFGAKVLHPRTMAPLVARGIPVWIRNTARPEGLGTRIGALGTDGGVKGVTTISGMALLNLEGAGLIGVPGTASRLFEALRSAGISVVLISQGSSEHSICCAVPEGDGARARAAVEYAFAAEMHAAQVEGVDLVPGCSILAVVGEGMRGIPGVAAKLFGALGRAGVNVRAIAQGASERNISAVIPSEDADRALRAVHAAFYLSPQAVSIGLIGPGGVGGHLLDQLAGEVPRLARDLRLDLRVRGMTGSRRMLLAQRAVDLADWRSALERGEPVDLDAFTAHVQAEHLPHAVIIDCSGNADIAARYCDWLTRGIHVITPSKLAASGPLSDWRRLQEARRAAGVRYLGETTVGAGLPIIQTLRDLRQTGDEIIAIEGILSGTLAFLFNGYDGSRPFSSIVREARALGFTEPDPRDDLSGRDVARKLVILAREMGLELELEQVTVESLVPAELAGGGIDEFLDGLAGSDARMLERLEAARARDHVLRYVARLDGRTGEAAVGLEELPGDHPFAYARLTDNVVQFVTRRYQDNPLVVQGPGAGPAVTAAGVFADLLRLAAYLGADV